ncbi:hypothetical protein [Pseudomonas aeruginosa]|uniref:hypothetical protein n=1 Tax=Pseudomonas aeruginosa TaxID=287 RepID=UPI00071BD310|nr:hypothetical protein [Pseudomonas aeruginosa]
MDTIAFGGGVRKVCLLAGYVHSALYLHLRATRKYEPTYVKTCVPLLDEIWEHLPKDSFAEQRVADAIGGLIEKEPCLQD